MTAFVRATTGLGLTPEDLYGPKCTTGSSFRARMEAQQRLYRRHVLECGFERYGHVLDRAARERGANFVHPAALAAARELSAIDVDRTFGDMLASEAACLNLFAPLARTDDGRALAGVTLARFIPGVDVVRSIVLAGANAIIEIDQVDGSTGLLVIATRVAESSFGRPGPFAGADAPAGSAASNREAARAVFALCAASENDALLADAVVAAPAGVVLLPLEGIIDALWDATERRGGDWHDWVHHLVLRYVPMDESSAPLEASAAWPRDPSLSR